MATLRETLLRNKKAGTQMVTGPTGLRETSTEEVASLAGKAGLPAAPITALGTAAIGGNEHQQKMAGSPAQVQNALRISQQPEEYLGTQQRREQPRSEMTAQEQGQRQKSDTLKDLGGLGDRVDKFINKQRQQLEAANVAASQVQVAPQEGAAPLPTDPTTLTNVKNAAKALLTNPSDMNALLLLNQSLGKSANATITPEELSKLYEDSNSTLIRSGAETIDNDLQVEDLIAAGDFPYTATQLSELLGVPEIELSKYSIAQLKGQMEAVAQQEFQTTQQLEQQSGSSILGTAERGQARQLAREASRTGVRSTEQDVLNLERQIQDADQVTFGGESYTVDELLKDDTISGIISDYLNMDPESQAEFAKQEPALATFISNNQAILKEASDAMAAGAAQFQQIQTENLNVGKVAGTDISKGLLEAAIPGFGELSSTKYDIDGIGFFQRLNDLPEEQKKSLVQEMNKLSDSPATKYLVPEIAKLTKDQLAALSLEKPGSLASKLIQENVQLENQIQNLDPKDIDSIIKTFTGGSATDYAGLQKMFDDNRAAATLGLKGQDISAFDSNKDGKLDDPATLLKLLQNRNDPITLKAILNNKVKTFKPAEALPFVGSGEPTEKLVFDKLSPFAADGKITPEEVVQAGFSEAELYAITAGNLQGKWGRDTAKSIAGTLKTLRDNRTEKALADYRLPKLPTVISQGEKDTSGQTIDIPTQDTVTKYASVRDAMAANLQKLEELSILNKGQGDPTQKLDVITLASRIQQTRALLEEATRKHKELEDRRNMGNASIRSDTLLANRNPFDVMIDFGE
jgi:hypothetical protein